MNPVGIVSALGAEARHLGPAMRRRAAPVALPDGTLLVVSGIGCAAAARGARALVQAGAGALASWGMGGGLDPALRCGTVCLPSEVFSREGTAFPTERRWLERLSAAIAGDCIVAGGRLLTSHEVIGSVAEKAAAFRETGAAAVDMESVAIAEVAAEHGLPFIAVRVIVDTAADVLPPAVTAAGRAGHLQTWRLIGALALAPGDLPDVVRLARRYRTASRSLGAIARSGSLGCHAQANAPQPGAP